MPNLTLVQQSDTFEQWRQKTNSAIVDLNDLTGGGNIKISTTGIDVDYDNNDANSQFLLKIDGATKITVDLNGNLTTSGGINSTGNFAVNTNKFTVESATGNTSIAGNLSVTGNITLPTVGATIDGVDLSAFKTAYDNRAILKVYNVSGTLLFTM